MKKFLPFLAIFFLLNGCTLSMEDWVLPEEERGKDEPYTVESEYGTITYQFNDNVLYVTDRVQEDYIVRVEHDSILYFNGNIPDKWRPYVGMKLATGCSHLLPYGLNHRVVSVEDVGGILKVVATKVSTDEVYKHLSYCIDADIVAPDLAGMSEEELKDYGYELTIDPETGDTLIMDWNNYDVDKGLRPANAKRNSLKMVTRAETNEEKSEEGAPDDVNDGTKRSEFLNLFFDTRNIDKFLDATTAAHEFRNGLLEIAKARVQEATAGSGHLISGDPYIALGIESVHYQKAHAEEDKDKGFELKYTDSWTEWTMKGEVGYCVSADPGYKDTPADKSKMGMPSGSFLGYMKDAISKKAVPNKNIAQPSKGWNNLRIRVIITATPIPIAFIASATLTPTVELNGCLCFSATYTSDRRRVGYRVENKDSEKEDIDMEVSKGKITDASIVGKGSLKVGMAFRAAAGLEFAGTLGVTCGANVEAYVEGELSCDIGGAIKDGGVGLDNCDGNFKFYSDFYGDIQLHVAPLGISLWDKQIAKFWTIHLINWSKKYGPSIYFINEKVYTGKDFRWDLENTDSIGISGYYQFKDLDGAKALFNVKNYYPGMKLYFGPISDNNYVYMVPTDIMNKPLNSSDWKNAKEGETYHYYWKGLLNKQQKEGMPITEAHLVPVLMGLYNDVDYLYPGTLTQSNMNSMGNILADAIEVKDREISVDLGDPVITTVEAGQISGQPTYDFSDDHEQGAYVSTGGDEHGGQSVMVKKELRRYTFYTTVKVQGGTQLKEWGLKVYIFGPDGKKRLGPRHKLRVNKLRSGIYTFIFSFETDWGTTTNIDKENQHLYFRVLPYWTNPRASGDEIEAEDAASLKKYPINWEMEDTKSEEILNKGNASKWGTIDQKSIHDF